MIFLQEESWHLTADWRGAKGSVGLSERKYLSGSGLKGHKMVSLDWNSGKAGSSCHSLRFWLVNYVSVL